MSDHESAAEARNVDSSAASLGREQACIAALGAVAADFGDFILEEIDFFDKEFGGDSRAA